MSLRICMLLFLLLCGRAWAIDPLPFADAAQEQRFRALTAELRCVMCQNQSLADSNAGIAVDLRREVFDMMVAGRSDEQIKAFLTERYGDFVLYNPPLKPATWLLWFAPLGILLIGGALVVVILRRRAAQFAQSVAAPNNESREEW
jgi:cytochrome c-type biogenesis protein CcmH